MVPRLFHILLLVASASLPAGADDFARLAAPLLEKHCASCHGAEKQKGGIEVHHLRDTDSALRHHRFLENIAEQVESGDMPPEDDVDELPTDEERATLVRAIKSVATKLAEGDFPRNPGRTTIRRLNRNEYNYTIRDLFGVNTIPARDFPSDGAGGEGFDNVGDSLFIPPVLMEKYLEASRKVIETLYADKALLNRAMVARPNPRTEPETAARTVLQYHASLAFRRRVEKSDIDPLVTLFSNNLAAGRSFDEAMQTPLQALLVHPSFLFRIEADQPGQSEWRISQFELATRLSYFLWSSMPDRRLFKLADEGKLSDPAVLRAEVDRLLEDRRSETLARHFAGQWLGFDELRDVADPDVKRFPTFTPTLRAAMYRESVGFFNHLIRTNRPVSDLIHSDYTFVNSELARHYGIPGVSGEAMQQVKLTDPNRGGVIGQASILTVTSVPLRTSPVKRGKWILDNLLGTPPPPPPPDAGVLPADDKSSEGLSFRQQLEMHRTRPSCAGCHEKIDPLGFGLENFDAIGRWRDHDANGKPVDSLATLPGDITFSTPADLKKLLAESDELFLRNLCRKMLAYSLGRPLEYYDEPVVTDLVKTLRADQLRMRTLIHSVVASKPFQHRSATR
jgi:Protein of unknown function (DUF1592)/Protein of unknown function (DUF1588)/Protein of unknown function (DUF1587)/Protein of unknown function (DUF1585)/Protein of unknown function (DUF1595)/Planctomycete cytochrome C